MRNLIAYYSWGGTTERVAGMVKEQVGGDLYRINTVNSYPDGYAETTRVAKQELREKARPALAYPVPETDRYDRIFLGFPNWWGTMPMAVFTFLESADFSGKTIAPFCTHGGGGAGRSHRDIGELCPESLITQSLSLSSSGVRRADMEISRWLESLQDFGPGGRE